MFREQRYRLKKGAYGLLNKKPIYVIGQDGNLRIEWENPADKTSRAYDLEHQHTQVFIEGYANPVKIRVEDAETEDIKLMPSGKYQQFMEQKIISDAIQGGSLSGKKLMWLSGGTLVSVIITLIVLVAMLT